MHRFSKSENSSLASLLQQGTSIRRVRTIASMLLNVIRLLDLNSPRQVNIDELQTSRPTLAY